MLLSDCFEILNPNEFVRFYRKHFSILKQFHQFGLLSVVNRVACWWTVKRKTNPSRRKSNQLIENIREAVGLCGGRSYLCSNSDCCFWWHKKVKGMTSHSPQFKATIERLFYQKYASIRFSTFPSIHCSVPRHVCGNERFILRNNRPVCCNIRNRYPFDLKCAKRYKSIG